MNKTVKTLLIVLGGFSAIGIISSIGIGLLVRGSEPNAKPALSNQQIVALAQQANSGDSNALQELTNAAQAGAMDAQLALGFLYDKSNGVAHNDSLAAEWYRKAAEQGNSRAQVFLGEMYLHGRVVQYKDGQDEANGGRQAESLFRKAAEQGNSGGALGLGKLYQMGLGVPRDDEQAVLWFRKAAEKGNADAQLCLGMAYVQGTGVSLDAEQGLMWVLIARADGVKNPNADSSMYLAQSQCTPDQASQAQEEAQQWVASHRTQN